MKAKEIKNAVLLMLAALIWGLAFVAQSKGNGIGAFTFNGLRGIIGAGVLVPVILLLDKTGKTVRKPQTKAEKRILWIGGSLCGLSLFVASALQQIGINMGVAAGKAGFLTACYILGVPVLGIFLRRKCNWNVWLGVGIALVGLYFLCITEGFLFQLRDIPVVLCAICFSVQILLIDHFAPQTDPVRLSAVQFLTSGAISLVVMFFVEILGIGSSTGVRFQDWLHTLNGWDAWIPILYLGILSTGVAYTLQMVAQPHLNPTVASMIMSLESVFSAVFGWLILRQGFTVREGIGCILVFTAVILAQLPLGKRAKI